MESPGSATDDDTDRGLLDGCGDAFAEESVREIFLSKVYGLFAGHIFAALGIVLLVSESEAFQLYMASHPTLIWTAMFAPFIILYIAHRLGECRRTCPLDYLFLAMFTISLGFACGMVAALTSAPSIGLLLGFVGWIALNLSFYSLLAKCDVNMLATSGLALAVLALAMSFAVFIRKEWWKPALKMGALAYADALYLIYITDSMVCPGYHWELCPEEYPFATLNIYVDIIRLLSAFMNALSGEDNMSCEAEDA
jgi:FtsH-binding integral membrane protein